jgi:hypothetical protein
MKMELKQSVVNFKCCVLRTWVGGLIDLVPEITDFCSEFERLFLE